MRQPAAPKMTAAQRRHAVQAAADADCLIQQFRGAFVKLTISLAMMESLDPLRKEMERLEGWRDFAAAVERSPAPMAALRQIWNPDDEVRVP